ncbi:hypothetical protein LNV23_14650 [Paucibacter sp. DJ1R-11]|uniref:hypothetical protein n=1 Tax=Paucibacter sp. DJ1R-11 TaxID=2893556 RepID=UPI0021E5138A|nr:hypothetical protein [Paucibacter sp. DJ1R-11]MCV2364690.1 hypothetical protein [Paucibacter sp. DJ1R-11]
MNSSPPSGPAQRLRAGLRYACIAAVSLIAIALSESILQNTATLYLAYQPQVFLREFWFVLNFVAAFGLAGAVLESDKEQPGKWTRLLRAAALLLLLIGIFQVFRRSFSGGVALTAVWKLSIISACVAGSVLGTIFMSAQGLRRLMTACMVSLLAMFALQPGMPSYLLSLPRPSAESASTLTSTNASPHQTQRPSRRTVVVTLDEWDYEVAVREGFFDSPIMRGLLAGAYNSSQARPGGPNTLSSIPSMLRGQPFGPVQQGSPGLLISRSGERWEAGQASLFQDLEHAGEPYAIVGFYHDYCGLFRAAKSCYAEPLHFFPGWWSAMSRVARKGNDFDNAYSDFLLQWTGTYQRLHDASLRAIAAQDQGLVWLHLNLPHPPAAVRGGQPHSLQEDYRGNLLLAQQFVTELVALLKQRGPDFALVLTSDHWLREKELWRDIYVRQLGPGAGDAGKTDDQRVPFVVHFGQVAAGSQQSDDRAISTTAIRRLVPQLMHREVNTPADVAQFFRNEPALAPLSPAASSAGDH